MHTDTPRDEDQENYFKDMNGMKSLLAYYEEQSSGEGVLYDYGACLWPSMQACWSLSAWVCVGVCVSAYISIMATSFQNENCESCEN